MKQDFSGMTESERAVLFPILLEEHDPAWKDSYLREEAFLRLLFGEGALRISHIGSTAVPGLLAKPTVDILLEVSENARLPRYTEMLEENGYVANTPEGDLPSMGDLLVYLKGYTPGGFRGQVFHIHVRHSGDWDELYFRDYLALHPDTAMEYGALKRGLQRRYRNDRDGYTAAKGPFIKAHTARARAEFPGKYVPAK